MLLKIISGLVYLKITLQKKVIDKVTLFIVTHEVEIIYKIFELHHKNKTFFLQTK